MTIEGHLQFVQIKMEYFKLIAILGVSVVKNMIEIWTCFLPKQISHTTIKYKLCRRMKGSICSMAKS